MTIHTNYKAVPQVVKKGNIDFFLCNVGRYSPLLKKDCNWYHYFLYDKILRILHIKALNQYSFNVIQQSMNI